MRQLKIQKSITNRSSEALDKYLVEIGREPMVSLEEEIESLEQQQRQIENDLSDTSLTVEQLTEKSLLFASLKQQCEEKTNRWLELSERE